MFGQELARLADERGGEKIKAFAGQILKDHKATSAHMRALVQSGSVKVSLPTELTEVHLKELARLKNLRAAEFDKEFEWLQAELHEDAISLFERYGVGGEHPDLKRFAFRHLPDLREHWQLRKIYADELAVTRRAEPARGRDQPTGSSNLKPMLCSPSSAFLPYSSSISLPRLGA